MDVNERLTTVSIKSMDKITAGAINDRVCPVSAAAAAAALNNPNRNNRTAP